MSNVRELQRAFDDALRGARRRSRIPARLGYYDGSWHFDVPGWPGYVYVRVGPNADGETTTVHKALNLSVGLVPDLPIWLERNDEGIWTIAGVRDTEYIAFTGGTRTGAAVAPHTHEPGGGMVDPVSERRLTPGLVYATGSGLVVGVRPFAYRYTGIDRRFEGATVNLSSYLPGSGLWRWVKICLDPSSGSVIALMSDPISVNTQLTDTMLDSIYAADYIPLAGIRLRYDATELTENLIVDRRPFWSIVGTESSSAFVWWDPDQRPAQPSSLDDEFSDNSVDPKWSEFDPGSIQSVTESGGKLGLAVAGQTSEILTGLYQSLPGGDFTAVAKVSLNQATPEDGERWQAGLVLWDDATDSQKPIMLVGPAAQYINGTEQRVYGWSRFAAHNNIETTYTDVAPDIWSLNQPVYVRLRRSGSTYYFDAGDDGLTWRTLTVVPDFGASHIGIGLFHRASSQILTASFEFFRYRSAADASTDPVYGGVDLSTTRLTDLGDVDLETTPPSDGQALVYESSVNQWVAATPAPADHDHSGSAGSGGIFDAANLGSGSASSGQVLTADGAGGASWEDPASGNAYFDPQTPPETPNSVDDEFNGSKSSDWSWSTSPSSESFDYYGWLLVTLASANTCELRRSFSPGTNTEFGIEAMLSFPGWEDLDEAGIGVLDSSNNRIADFRIGIRNGEHVFLSDSPNNPSFDVVGSDLIVNGNIETALGSEWVTNNVARDSYSPYEGSYALRGANVAPTTTQYANYAKQTFTVSTPGIYILSCYIRRHNNDGNGGSYGRVRVKLVNPSGGTEYESAIVSSSSWTQIYQAIEVDSSKTGNWTFWFTPFSSSSGVGWDASRGQCDLVKFYSQEFQPAPILNRIWLRIHRNSSNIYRFWWSTDGLTWKLIYTSNAATGAVAKLALIFKQNTSTNKAFGVNYVRRYV